MAADAGSRKTTMWFIIGFLVLATAGVIIAGAMSSNSSTPTTTVTGTAPAITASDWTEGNPNAKVTLIEYGDFECPACGEYFPLVQQVVANYSSTVLFVFRNYPLYSIHPFAGIGAQAAEAAGLEGGAQAYWKMHDLLYENQNTWSTNSTLTTSQVVSEFFNGYAQSIGLNVTTFDNDMNATSVLDKIQTDVAGGDQGQVDHTPTFFINLQQIPNPNSLSDFENDLNAALASSTGGNSSTSPVQVQTSGSGTLSVTSTPL